jgi:hypothetical protein
VLLDLVLGDGFELAVLVDIAGLDLLELLGDELAVLLILSSDRQLSLPV